MGVFDCASFRRRSRLAVSVLAALVCSLVITALALDPASAAPTVDIPVVAEFQPELPAGHTITSAALARDGSSILFAHAGVDGSDPALVLMAADGSWTETAPVELTSIGPIDSRMVSDEGNFVVFLADDAAWLWALEGGTASPIRQIAGITGASISGNGDHVGLNYPDGLAYRIFRPTGFVHAVGGPMTYMDEQNRILSPVFSSRLEVHVWVIEGGGASWYYNEERLCPEKVYRCNDGAALFLLGSNTAGMIHETERGAVYLELTKHLSLDDHFVIADGLTISLHDASGAHGFLRQLSLRDMIEHPDYGPKQAEVVRLYQAYFDRFPDSNGVRYWLRIQAQGHDVQQIAAWMSDQEEFVNTYQNTTNDQYVEMIYTNVLGRDFDQAGYLYWLGLLDAGELDRAGVVYWITRNTEFIENYPFL